MLKNNLAFILPISLGRVLRMPLHLQDGGTSTPCWHYMSWPVSRQRKKKEEHQSIEMNNWVQWEQKDKGRARNARCSVYLFLSLTFSPSSLALSFTLNACLFAIIDLQLTHMLIVSVRLPFPTAVCDTVQSVGYVHSVTVRLWDTIRPNDKPKKESGIEKMCRLDRGVVGYVLGSDTL